MAIADYTYSGPEAWIDMLGEREDVPGDGAGIWRDITDNLDVTGNPGLTDRYSSYPGIIVTPVTDLFVQGASGQFLFVLDPKGMSDTRNEYRFDFYKQGPDPQAGFYRLVIEYQAGFAGFVYMRLEGHRTNNLNPSISPSIGPIIFTEEILTDGNFGAGIVAGIRWETSFPGFLSNDLASPDFPALTFQMLYADNTLDPADALIKSCVSFDLSDLHNQDPLDSLNPVEAAERFGGGIFKLLQRKFQAFEQAALDGAAAILGPGSAAFLDFALQAIKNFTVTVDSIQSPMAINQTTPGFVTTALDGKGGVINPQLPESWGGNMDYCLGWEYKLVGQDSLVTVIINEPWELPANPPGVLLFEEFWQDAGVLGTFTIERTESWDT